MATMKQAFERDHYNIISKLVRRTRVPITAEQATSLEENLDKLPSILGDEGWTLTGGIAAQLASGSWYRNPGNVNISVNEDEIFEIAEHAHKKANYRLLSRGWQVRPLPGMKRETYEVPRWNIQALARNYPNLRLIRFEENNPSSNKQFLDFIDVHLYRIAHHRYERYPELNSDDIVSLDGNKETPIIPLALSEQNRTYSTQSGKTFLIRSLEYIHAIKYWLVMQDRNQKRRERGIDYFDFMRLELARRLSKEISTNLIKS